MYPVSQKNMQVVRLKPYHKDQFLDLMRKRRNILSTNFGILDAYLDVNSKFPVLFGIFQRQKLLSTLGLWRWEVLPYATITYLLTQPGNKFFNRLTNGHSLCFEEMIRYGNENGILAYYAFQKKRKKRPAYEILPKQLKGYLDYTEAVIPKNTQPKESIYWELMDQEIKSFVGEIRRIILWPPISYTP